MENTVLRLQEALNEARASLSLAPVYQVPVHDNQNEDDPDNLVTGEEGFDSPEGLVSAPIRSLYEVTRLQEAKAGEKPPSSSSPSGTVVQPDFIARGIISIEKAEQLTHYYLNRLDHFFYDFLQKYTSISQIRETSTLLALMLCTVAAIHDPLESEAYDRLSRELRDLTSTFLFRERLGLEDIKALCLGGYWLSDMTSSLSSLAFHKATSMQFHVSHLNQPDSDVTCFQTSQLWLIIYLLNEQISILRGLPSSGMGRDFIKWEHHMESKHATEIDLRMVSHIDLLLILNRVRELYGLDTSKSIPSTLIPELRDFTIHIDKWGHNWCRKLAINRWIGNFPAEAIQLHWQVAKFYVYSHVFRGLDVSSPTPTTVLNESEDMATNAIATALSILQLLTGSETIRGALIGMPHWFHTMFAFTAVFLLKVVSTFRRRVTVDVDLVLTTCKETLEVFRHSPCARQHLVHRISKGLSDMIRRCEATIQVPNQTNGTENIPSNDSSHFQQEQATSTQDYGVGNGLYDSNQAWLDFDSFGFLSMPPPLDWNMDFNT